MAPPALRPSAAAGLDHRVLATFRSDLHIL